MNYSTLFEYLSKTGLAKILEINSLEDLKQIPLPDFDLQKILSSISFPNFSDTTIQNSICQYDVPTPSKDEGSFSCSKKKYNIPFDVWSHALQQQYTTEEKCTQLQKIYSLQQIMKQLQQMIQCEWIGIYKMISNWNHWIHIHHSEPKVLIKLAYVGQFSRPDFPVNEEWIQRSTNSTVGLRGQGIVKHGTEDVNNPYYVCDASVQSEACIPIFDSSMQNIIGIIDAEAYPKGFFTKERILVLAMAAIQIDSCNLF